jgi:phosphoglycolate phosphatase-like HAD superfamily hydrolase
MSATTSAGFDHRAPGTVAHYGTGRLFTPALLLPLPFCFTPRVANVQLVLFDIDGTLIHTQRAGVMAFGRTFESVFGIARASEGIRFAGRTDTGILREMCVRHGIPPTPENFRRFFDTFVHWLEEMLHETNGGILPGVGRFLAELRALPQPPTVGLLTGNIRLGAELKLRRFDLWGQFVMGAFGDEHEDRNQLAILAHRRGSQRVGRPLRGEEILVIGDTPHDIACANAIGARCLAVATGGATFEELARHRPRWTVRDLSEIEAAEACAQ